MVKLLAFHLPQYYSFVENDKWWGKGFTDWTNVRNAIPLFKGHNQPRVPLDGYYNMLDKSTHIRQAQLAKEYGIYGFCYYHYWFNGKLLMEKPLELILKESEVNLPFCMCWANEPWTRSWDGKNKEIIMPQNYGDEKDWVDHINYLIPFFKDERYIKIDGKPVFVIYRTNSIDRCDEIITCWNEICIENGFSGIYAIEERNSFQYEPICKNTAGVLEFEPVYTHVREKTTIRKALNKVQEYLGKNYSTYSYEKTCAHITSRELVCAKEKQLFLGVFSGWDNTPRRKVGGEIAIGSTPELFGKTLKKQIERSNAIGSEFLFINAWNEWAEGAYLEPDEMNGYGYLEAVKAAVSGKQID